MLERVGWPSQLEQVDLFLREHSGLLRINVQQLSGAELTSIEIHAQATLQDLEAVISESLKLHCKPGVLFHFVLRETLLTHELSGESGRWKSLSEYGIAQGDTLCLVMQEEFSNRMISIAVLELPCGEATSIEINNGATLFDLENKIREQKSPCHHLDANFTFAFPGQTPFSSGCNLWKTLAEYGIDNGTTLVWTSRAPFRMTPLKENKGNVPCEDVVDDRPGASLVPLRPAQNFCFSPESETITVGLCQDTEDPQEVMAAPYTPTRGVRDMFDRAPSACKTRKSRDAKAGRALKRL